MEHSERDLGEWIDPVVEEEELRMATGMLIEQPTRQFLMTGITFMVIAQYRHG